MYLLNAAEKYYSWGSRSAIQNLTGIGIADETLAEIWYGAHPAGPATLEDGRPLNEMISNDAAHMLGDEIAERFDGQLPFLVKLIAPGKAVSLQVHPRAERAREAHAEQLSSSAPEPKFVDANHKPEQILALTKFDGLVGLLPVADAEAVLDAFDHPLTRAAGTALARGDEKAIRDAIAILAGASTSEIDLLVDVARAVVAEGEHAAAATLLELAEQYPGDSGLAASLMLRRIYLEPGESVMVLSGVPHAYMSGLALEVMANSDNVFRLGLTAKRVDVEESVANLITSPALVNRPHRSAAADSPEEFDLEVHALRPDGIAVAGPGPRILVAITSGCTVRSADQSIALEPGHAVFLPHGSAAVAAAKSGQIAVISVPSPRERC